MCYDGAKHSEVKEAKRIWIPKTTTMTTKIRDSLRSPKEIP
jgi:hypothetical protein